MKGCGLYSGHTQGHVNKPPVEAGRWWTCPCVWPTADVTTFNNYDEALSQGGINTQTMNSTTCLVKPAHLTSRAPAAMQLPCTAPTPAPRSEANQPASIEKSIRCPRARHAAVCNRCEHACSCQDCNPHAPLAPRTRPRHPVSAPTGLSGI